MLRVWFTFMYMDLYLYNKNISGREWVFACSFMYVAYCALYMFIYVHFAGYSIHCMGWPIIHYVSLYSLQFICRIKAWVNETSPKQMRNRCNALFVYSDHIHICTSYWSPQCRPMLNNSDFKPVICGPPLVVLHDLIWLQKMVKTKVLKFKP